VTSSASAAPGGWPGTVYLSILTSCGGGFAWIPVMTSFSPSFSGFPPSPTPVKSGLMQLASVLRVILMNSLLVRSPHFSEFSFLSPELKLWL